jgi:hypothetical protein
LVDSQEPTKRRVTSIVGKFYDPLGYLSPVVIKFKILFQELCEKKCPTQVADFDHEFEGGSNLLDFLTGTNGQVISYRLHGFCDASERAYAAVIYLVVQTDSERCVRFVASKTRVAPLRELAIPRLELLSSLLLARLMDTVQQGTAESNLESGSSRQPIEAGLRSVDTQEHQEPERVQPSRTAAVEARDRMVACSILENDT